MMKIDKKNNLLVILFSLFFAMMIISFIFDMEILKFFNNLSSPGVLLFMHYASHDLFFIGVILISSLLLWDKKKIIFLWAGTGFAYALSIVLKSLIQRVRPLSASAFDNLGTFSFPSSHATVYFFIFAFIFWHFEKNIYYRLIFLAIAVLVSLSRVFIGVHYLSDVIGGGLLGIGSYLFLRRWIKA